MYPKEALSAVAKPAILSNLFSALTVIGWASGVLSSQLPWLGCTVHLLSGCRSIRVSAVFKEKLEEPDELKCCVRPLV